VAVEAGSNVLAFALLDEAKSAGRAKDKTGLDDPHVLRQ